MTDAFFVYGTLKVGGRFAEHFDGVRTKSTPVTIDGFALYSLGWFPTVVREEGSVVHGEIHEYTDSDMVLRHFDHIEGYTGDPEYDLYNREQIQVTLPDGETCTAYIYIFARELPANAKRVDNGVWPV